MYCFVPIVYRHLRPLGAENGDGGIRQPVGKIRGRAGNVCKITFLMSYLLFIDESGHDHQSMPYEVRGGVAVHSSNLWNLVQALGGVEERAFGVRISTYGHEVKGHRLLDKRRFRWAAQQDPLDDVARRKHSIAFLNKGQVHGVPSRIEFAAYGQACLQMARDVFRVLNANGAKLFAVAIPRDVARPDTMQADEFLRKDQVFLLERYFYFLESQNQQGLIVLDETDRTEDRRFIKKLERYFLRTQTGRFRSTKIVPTPFLVSSEMSSPIQAADVCIYALNWGFRLPNKGMDAPTRPEIEEFVPWILELRAEGDAIKLDGTHHWYGITYVPDPYTAR